MMTSDQREVYLSLAKEPWRSEFARVLSENTDWYSLQQRFLESIDRYIGEETGKPVEKNIGSHEAGGQFRIAFPHRFVRGDKEWLGYLKALIEARKKYTDANQFHGYVDCHEVHHEIETYLYFQMPLWYLKFPGAETAAMDILDTAEHTGNWVPGVPSWYDWKRCGFVSTFLGTRGVKNYPPYDYQEGNHFRFTDLAMAAYKISRDPRYMELLRSYADRWSAFIEKHAPGQPIPCSILPDNAEVEALDRAGIDKNENGKYKIFYQLVSSNTMYDIVSGLLDIWRETREDRYMAAAEKMMDQFYDHSVNGRLPTNYINGVWVIPGDKKDEKPESQLEPKDFYHEAGFLPRLAVKHCLLTGTEKYRERTLAWAKAIDEEKNRYDQILINLMVAAHFFSGDPGWLTRAHQMAARFMAVVEDNDEFHQCNANSRQGSKYQMEMLYHPVLGDIDWATRGNMPLTLIRHKSGGRLGLPPGVSFRLWRTGKDVYTFEAVNTGSSEARWEITLDASGKVVKELKVAPGAAIKGVIN
jgi:hypothetical protein